MNRTAALLLALTTLLAHSLLIHQDHAGHFAPPYEMAHVAFRLARNFVFAGDASWNPGTGLVESYPCPLWVAVCVVGERLYLPVTLFAQTVGVACTLGCVFLAARFASDRLAGVIAPLLLVVNGGVAAAGTGGTETGLLTLLVTAAFLAQESRRPRVLGVACALLWACGLKGAFAVCLFFAFELVRRLRGAGSARLSAFVPALAVALAMAGLRLAATGSLFSPDTVALARGGNPAIGARYVAQFAQACGSPFLVVVPLAYLAAGRLVGRARRALVFSLAWTGLVAWSGGDGLPFWNAFVPMLPLLFLSVQDAMVVALDRGPRWAAAAGLALLFAGVTASILASKLPGKIGPLPAPPIPTRWIARSELLADAYGRPPGRLGLVKEIQLTERLRSVGVFLRDNLGARSTVLTPWPGAIGYLSRLVVYDARGRATPSPGRPRPQPWFGHATADLAAHLERRPDYVVAWVDTERSPPGREELARSWLARFDVVGPSPERLAEVLRLLESYELIAVPVPAHSSDPETPSATPAYLLRRTDLNFGPRLRVTRAGSEVRVTAKHRGHFQLADLELTVQDAERVVWYVRPTGVLERDAAVRARKGLLFYNTGTRSVELLRWTLPEGLEEATVRAVLRSPGTGDPASREVLLW